MPRGRGTVRGQQNQGQGRERSSRRQNLEPERGSSSTASQRRRQSSRSQQQEWMTVVAQTSYMSEALARWRQFEAHSAPHLGREVNKLSNEEVATASQFIQTYINEASSYQEFSNVFRYKFPQHANGPPNLKAQISIARTFQITLNARINSPQHQAWASYRQQASAIYNEVQERFRTPSLSVAQKIALSKRFWSVLQELPEIHQDWVFRQQGTAGFVSAMDEAENSQDRARSRSPSSTNKSRSSTPRPTHRSQSSTPQPTSRHPQ